jgi:sulfur carrier protein
MLVRRIATVTISAPLASMAARVCSISRYLPVPTSSRERYGRPAITSASEFFMVWVGRRTDVRSHKGAIMERVMGIEPTLSAWEAEVLPLNYTRFGMWRQSLMQIIVNGETRPLPPGQTLLDLLQALQLDGRRLAVELNGTILARSQHGQTRLADGDRLEIIHAVGGG